METPLRSTTTAIMPTTVFQTPALGSKTSAIWLPTARFGFPVRCANRWADGLPVI